MYDKNLINPQESFLEDNINDEVDEMSQQKFDSKYEYFFSVLGFAAGYGSLYELIYRSIWRFPYLVWKNGGGAFMIPYLFCFIFFSIPAFYFEVALGQMYQKASPQLFQIYIGKKYKGLGVFSVMLCLILSTFYNVLLAYSYSYFFSSFSNPLPWYKDAENDQDSVLYAKNYFYNQVLKIDRDPNAEISLNGSLYGYFALSMLLVYFCIFKGIKTSGKIAIYTASAPYLILIILLFRGLVLDGSMKGLYYLLTPNFTKVFELSCWSDAISQCLYQYSVGYGMLILFGSYNDKKTSMIRLSLEIQFAVLLCGILSALTIFCYIGHVSVQLQQEIHQLPLSGPDLTFVAYPIALTLMPFSNLWSILFFVMMITLGIDTQFGLVEAVAAAIEAEKNFYFQWKVSMQVNRALISVFITICGAIFCTNKGFDLLIVADQYAQVVPLMSMVLFQTYFFAFFRDIGLLENQIKLHNNSEFPYLYKISTKYLAIPLLILLIISSLPGLIMQSFQYPFWKFCFAWIFFLCPYLFAYYIYFINKDETSSQTLELSDLKNEQSMR